MKPSELPPAVLIIAGNDPSGGAGICADTQTVTRLGCHPAPVISALTVQDTINAYEVEVQDPLFVRMQAETVLKDFRVRAIKLGLLGDADIGNAVAITLAKFPEIPVITDPVLVAAGGAQLAENRLIDVYRNEILPRTTVLTPNAHELRRLTDDVGSLGGRATSLLNTGCQYVLHKGGDEDTEDVVDRLYARSGEMHEFRTPRVEGRFHGSGCTLASAIAAYVARGVPVARAVELAQAFVQAAIANSWQLGKGQRVLNRLCP